mmetsp:Transcript_42550/g.47367  ORF Transcript_42550/g.47367 Transcript_42550/m.47367 type:complete len:96 (+) Transcript_42550:1317-1604(+)
MFGQRLRLGVVRVAARRSRQRSQQGERQQATNKYRIEFEGIVFQTGRCVLGVCPTQHYLESLRYVTALRGDQMNTKMTLLKQTRVKITAITVSNK